MGFYLCDRSCDDGLVKADCLQELEVMRMAVCFILDLSFAPGNIFGYARTLIVSTWQEVGYLTGYVIHGKHTVCN